MTWSEAQVRLANTGMVWRFEFVQKVLIWIKVSIVGIVAVSPNGAFFVVDGRNTVAFDRATGLFTGLTLRAQFSNDAAVALHTGIAHALGLV